MKKNKSDRYWKLLSKLANRKDFDEIIRKKGLYPVPDYVIIPDFIINTLKGMGYSKITIKK